MREVNSCSKTVDRNKAYEIWQTHDGSWTWFVRKKYQSPKNEANNPYARWLCDVVTPIVPEGETGDVYCNDNEWDKGIKSMARRIK